MQRVMYAHGKHKNCNNFWLVKKKTSRLFHKILPSSLNAIHEAELYDAKIWKGLVCAIYSQCRQHSCKCIMTYSRGECICLGKYVGVIMV